MCPLTIYVSVGTHSTMSAYELHVCPLTVYVSSYYICVLLLYMCPLTIDVHSYYMC
jgi:hypothetical protein